MLDYFIKVLLFQVLFLAVYDIILKKETFFQWNRAYLIVTSVLAYIIPTIKIQKVAQVVPQEYVVWLPEVMLSPQTVLKESIDWSSVLFSSLKWIFLIGVLIATVLFVVKFVKLITTIHKNEKEKVTDYNLVHLNSTSAFSFFNYIFLGKHISKDNKAQIIEHELVHVKQKHSIDLLFFELQKIVCWFNPFSYIYQSRISELHEFIADSKSIKQEDRKSYFQNILAEAFGTQKISFINHFFKHSLIKKRIVMLNKAKSKQLLKFKYLLMVPLLAGMLIYTSCEKQDEVVMKDKSVEELINEIKVKSDEMNLSEEDLKGLIDVINNSLQNTDDVERQKKIKQALFLYILQKREELLANSSKKAIEGKEIIDVRSERRIVEGKEIDYTNLEDVPFAVIEEAPIFPGCEGENTKNCLNRSIQEHIGKNFNADLAQSLNLTSGKKKVFVQFKITKTGGVEILGTRAPHPELEQEARRVVELLPKMTPGKQRGKDVNVTYMLPISFNVK